MSHFFHYIYHITSNHCKFYIVIINSTVVFVRNNRYYIIICIMYYQSIANRL
uniref:Uncharacterized protein n=1 Tax=Ciona intestinalis TaxID=7719 RepID=H2XYJ4_CIOIN